MEYSGSNFEKVMREKEWNQVLSKTGHEGLSSFPLKTFIKLKFLATEPKTEDLRPLKIRLQEQRQIKEQAWKESFRSVVAIEEEDKNHYENVAKMKAQAEARIRKEDFQAIADFRQQIAQLHEEENQKVINVDVKTNELQKIDKKKSVKKEFKVAFRNV